MLLILFFPLFGLIFWIVVFIYSIIITKYTVISDLCECNKFEVRLLEILNNVELSEFSSFRLGGKSRYYTEINSIEDIDNIFTFINKNKLDFLILGGGTNLLISDEGFDGIVLKINTKKIDLNVEKKIVSVDTGFELDKLINLCIENNLSGLENMSGIPGTIGGAIRGNAGAYRTEIKDVLESVTVYDNGDIKTIDRKDCDFSYRYSKFKKQNKLIILSATIKLEKGDKESLLKKRKEIIELRESKQPLEYPNLGSFFKNPIVENSRVPTYLNIPSWKINYDKVKLSAAWLIEQSELKGLRINDIGVSEKHSLFFVNYGKGRAKDVVELTRIVQARVKEKFNIKIYPEPEFVGFPEKITTLINKEL